MNGKFQPWLLKFQLNSFWRREASSDVLSHARITPIFRSKARIIKGCVGCFLFHWNRGIWLRMKLETWFRVSRYHQYIIDILLVVCTRFCVFFNDYHNLLNIMILWATILLSPYPIKIMLTDTYVRHRSAFFVYARVLHKSNCPVICHLSTEVVKCLVLSIRHMGRLWIIYVNLSYFYIDLE